MTTINIIFSTKNEDNTNNLLASIIKSNALDIDKNYKLAITIFDKTHEQKLLKKLPCLELDIKIVNITKIKVLENKHLGIFKKANCSTAIDSIQRARIQQQIYIIEQFETFKNTIIWQVDDDMLFGKSEIKNNKHEVNYSTNYFSKIKNLYLLNENVDAIISPSTYVPPIPSLLYCESQLMAYFNDNNKLNGEKYTYEYHDYYNQLNKSNSSSIFLEKNIEKTTDVKNILIGKPVTKISYDKNINDVSNTRKSTLLRGGNFIIFNPEIFKIPHLGFSENNKKPARRSDMIHSHLLTEVGFQIRDISYFSLVHNRDFNHSSIENSCEKYFSDMIGALVVAYLYKGEDDFSNRLLFHQSHIKNILHLLLKNINKKEFINEIDRLTELDVKINSFEKAQFISEFEKFKTSQENLKSQLCKLV